MQPKTALVITSISAPNKALKDYAIECQKRSIDFILMGDIASPSDFELKGCDFYGLGRQEKLPFWLAEIAPQKSYSRKNLGYLQAIKSGAEIILETDDDNHALPAFWNKRNLIQNGIVIKNDSWVNVYKYFTDINIWPRGFALEYLADALPELQQIENANIISPIQQGLTNENPDVDAMYRLILPLPVNFNTGTNILLGAKTWCPFNSQNTTWFKEAFPLMYLPSFCSFRMTDIWRSFVAERICWQNGWHILFHSATVRQERNVHDLMKDFADEIPGYTQNKKLCEILEKLDIKPGKDNIPGNLVKCYNALIENGIIGEGEIQLLDAWIEDLDGLH